MTNVQRLGEEWLEAMLAGDFERAWRASDRIRTLGYADPHRFWLGEDFAGKRVMLRCLHGFGDSVQFLRFVPMLRARAQSVCVEVAPRFVELARCLVGVDEVITWADDAPKWDVQMEVTELPYLFRTQLADLPVAEDYLRVEPTDGSAGQRRVGIVWRAGEWNPSREVRFDLLTPLLEMNGFEFWNLTQGPAEGPMKVDEASRGSLLDLAKRIASLDLVITVDTLAAHLAGALGVPAWVLLKQDCDWRWMRVREDSPWYPSVRLFRQEDGGGWEAVIERVAQALRERHA